MKFIELGEVKNIVKPNSTIAIGGFTINRKPLSIIKEIIKNKKIKDLNLFLLAGSIDVDLMVRESKVSKISAAYVGYEGLGLSKITRKAIESKKILFEDLTEIIYYFGLKAGAENKPFLLTESVINSDILKINSYCQKIFLDGKKFCKIEKINPDFSFIHAQKVDAQGNILLEEPDFCEKEMAKASKTTIFSVEEVGTICKEHITIPKEDVDYVVVCKKGAYPTGCKNFYGPNIKEILKFIGNENL